MKKSFLIVGLILIALFIAIGWLLNTRGSKQDEIVQKGLSSPKRILGSKTSSTNHSEDAEEAERDRMRELVKTGKMTQEEYDEWRGQKRIKESLKSNVPIRFYGKVIDQTGSPILAVKVKLIVYSADISQGTMDQKRTELEFMTDANGRFLVEKQKGYSMGIQVLEKEGYEPHSSYERSFMYFGDIAGGLHHPDSNNPVIFKMWKKTGAEDVIHHQKNIRIPYGGTPVLFDLVECKKAEPNQPGDLRITLLRTPLKIEPRQKYDWVATIDAIDGGVIESKDDFMNLAPESGYEPGLEIQMLASNPQWKPDMTIPIYLKSRGGKHYARVILEFRTGSDRETTGFTITSYLNPFGSRNLEYDPLFGVKLMPTK